jgi:hypothetical protein
MIVVRCVGVDLNFTCPGRSGKRSAQRLAWKSKMKSIRCQLFVLTDVKNGRNKHHTMRWLQEWQNQSSSLTFTTVTSYYREYSGCDEPQGTRSNSDAMRAAALEVLVSRKLI